MKVTTVDGREVEISKAELERLTGADHSGSHTANHTVEHAQHHKHHFHINGVPTAVSSAEMKMIADYWWEHYGKAKMQTFFENYQKKAAENIRKVTENQEAPKSEKEVKEAIAEVLVHGTAEEAAEVLFEAMEWQTAYANLKSIE